MPQALEDPENREYPFFGESGDHLHLVMTTSLSKTQYTVYEMERDYSKWPVKYNVDLNALLMVFPKIIWGYIEPPDLYYYAIDVFLVVREKKDEDSFLVLRIPGKDVMMHATINFEDQEYQGNL